jgi:hypothetical protein
MFQVVHKDHCNLMDDLFFSNFKTVYDVKKNFDTNEVTFLFYDYDKKNWYYESADDYMPISQSFR